MSTFNGKILRINLTDGSIKEEGINQEIAKKYIGGRGYATKVLYDEGVAGVEPLSPENKLFIMTGPLTGAPVPTGGRYMAITKSPLTGMIACSNSGGKWGAQLKYSGIDGIIFEGKSEKPVYLNIQDGKAELKCAAEIWGKNTEDVTEVLKESYPDASVLTIGIAGENLSLLAAIMNDYDRAAGRSGVGAVMGSKNLKAITVTASKSSMTPAKPDELKQVVADCQAKIKENGVTGGGLPTYGTAVLVNIINNVGSFPTKNWQESYFEHAEDISGETLKEKYLVKQGFCHRCPIGCGRVIKRNDKNIGGPEYEVLWAYGGNCGVKDIEAVNEANFWCNEYGMDAISVPCTIAAAMELYQLGAIKPEECEGVPLEWGNSEAIVEWTKRMGAGQTALGKLMAQGSYRLCEFYGHPEVSMSVKKQELPAYDARGIQGIGINYATSNRGGCHVRGYMISPEVLGIPEGMDRVLTENKAVWTKAFQDLTAAIDSSGMCLFTSFALGAPEYAGLLSNATGFEYSSDSVMEAGDRIYNIERLFNKAAGMKPEDDKLPKRMFEPITNGPSKGMISKLDMTLPEYYAARGWENGFPTEETIKKLEL